MKKTLLLFCFAIIASGTFSQSSIPNGNFENWISTNLENPQFYPVNSYYDVFFYYQLPFNLIKSTDAYHGNYAIELTTVANTTDTAAAYFVNGNPDGDPSNWTGGMAINEKPNGIRGYYKYNVDLTDSATILVAFSKAGVNIGFYMFTIGGIQTNYTLFEHVFSPALSQTPDSVIIAVLSCRLTNTQNGPSGPAGSTLLLDSLSFTGISNQPAEMNGDFELWENQLIESPSIWNVESYRGEGVAITTDAAAGQYAIELTTFIENYDGSPKARGARVSTGYYPDNCNGNCIQLGGYPFSNQIDTLAFSFKYFPSNNDTAAIRFNFKNNFTSFWSNEYYLLGSPTYQYYEIPFDLFMAPDSVIIDIQSTKWGDSLVSFAGSVLIIDEVHFKSQPLGTNIFSSYLMKNAVSFYPNPFRINANIDINVDIDIQGTELNIIDLSGKIIKTIPVTSHKLSIQKEDLSKGLYYYELTRNNQRINFGKFIVE